ncbi:MAG: ATP synthase F1 subunit delta [Deferribacteraceae bacterium]|jgi:F-type H+-transporting ATPase subunit delta|nr:ATP synthase F1 subunit delta [Deferribacteraceae bacterium]
MIIASRYANALYEEAKTAGLVNEVVQDLRQLKDLTEQNKDFEAFLNSIVISTADKLNVINAIGKSGKINRLTYAFLVALTKNKRLDILSETALAINKRISEERGEMEVYVSYASSAEDYIRTALIERLSALTKKKVILKESVDSALLGGMRILIGNTLYDMSVKGRLEALKNQIAK